MATLIELETALAATNQRLAKLEKFVVQLVESWAETGEASAAMRDVVGLVGERMRPDHKKADAMGVRKSRVPEPEKED